MITGGNCAGEDTEIFYDSRTWGKAKAICDGCPMAVLLECREAFAEDPYAFAGGMRPMYRLRWAQNRRDEERKVEALHRPEVNPSVNPGSPRERRDQVIEIFDSGLVPAREIARRTSMSKTSVIRILREAGRKRTPEEIAEMSRQGGERGGRSTSNPDVVAQMHADGATTEDIMRETGLSRSHIYAIRRKWGIAPDLKANEKKVRELLEEGKEAKAIAHIVGISMSRVYQIRNEWRAEET